MKVWINIKKYAELQKTDENVLAKYVIVPGINDNMSEITAFLQQASDVSIKTIVLDIEHDYYFENKNKEGTYYVKGL